MKIHYFYKKNKGSLVTSIHLFLSSFHKLRWSTYIVELQADDDLVFVSIPENVTHDIAGNKNLASNVLQVRHCKILFSDSVIIMICDYMQICNTIIYSFLISFFRCKF
jgi:hypothetical protein